MARGNRSGGQGQPGQAQKQLSPVIKLALEHNPDDLAKWRESCAVSEDAFDNLAQKKREPVLTLMKSGTKAFPVAAQTLINLVSADPDAGLSASDLSSLQSDVFSKTAEAIAKAEKEKAEAAETKKKDDAKKKQEEERKKSSGEVHSFADFLGRTLGKEARAERLARFAAFSKLLTPEQKEKFAKGLEKGDQMSKFETLAAIEKADEAVALAESMGWI